MDLRTWLETHGIFAAFVAAGVAIAVFTLFRGGKSRRKNEPYSFFDHVMGVSMWDRVLHIDDSDPAKAARVRRRVRMGWTVVLGLLLAAFIFDL